MSSWESEANRKREEKERAGQVICEGEEEQREAGMLQDSSSWGGETQPCAYPRSATLQGISAACMRPSAFSTRPCNVASAHCTLPLLALITTCCPSTSTKTKPCAERGAADG